MKIIENINSLEELEQLINIKQINHNNISISFEDNNVIRHGFDKNNVINFYNIKNTLLENIKILSNLSDESYKNIKEEQVQLSILDSLILCTNQIKEKGKIGYATHMCISKFNYNKLNIESLLNDELQDIIIFLDDSIEDIILYRKNNTNEPGLLYLYNEELGLFNIIDIGFYPENQFMKIKLETVNI